MRSFLPIVLLGVLLGVVTACAPKPGASDVATTAAKAASSLGSHDVELAWVVRPSVPDAEHPEVYELRRRPIELLVSTANKRQRVLLPSVLGTLDPDAQSACAVLAGRTVARDSARIAFRDAPNTAEEETDRERTGVGSGYAVRFAEPGRLAITAWSSDPRCEDGQPCAQDEEVASVVVSDRAAVRSESIVVIDHTGRTRRLDCRSERPQ